MEALTAKADQLSTLLRSVQQVQVQPLPPSLPAAGSISAQSFRIGGNGGLQRFHSNARMLAPTDLDGAAGGFGGGLKTAPSFRMGGKPPTTPSGHLGFGMANLTPVVNTGVSGVVSPPVAPRAPFFFSGGGTIQRNRANRPGISPSPPVSVSPISPSAGSTMSNSTNSSCEDLTVLDTANVNSMLDTVEEGISGKEEGVSGKEPAASADSEGMNQDANPSPSSKPAQEEDNVAVGIAVSMEN